DDCDGTKDEGVSGVGASCSIPNQPGCQAGFTAPGKVVCKGSNGPKCEAIGGTHYCNAAAQTVNGQFCGSPPGQSCSTAGGLPHHGDCPPNSLCSESGVCTGWVDPPCGPNSIYCWMPADNNLCDGVNVPNGWQAP